MLKFNIKNKLLIKIILNNLKKRIIIKILRLKDILQNKDRKVVRFIIKIKLNN